MYSRGCFAVGCLLPVAAAVGTWAIVHLLFDKMGWPGWIVSASVILAFLGFVPPFIIVCIVGTIAGFFHEGLWPWSLAVMGISIVHYGIEWGIRAAVRLDE